MIDHSPRLGEGFSNTLKQVVSSKKQAEGVGFEPTDALRHLRFSRPVEDSHNPLPANDIGKNQNPAVPSAVSLFPKDLQEIIQAWAKLPEPIRAGIHAMVKAWKENKRPRP